MAEIVLATINAKYAHASFGLRYLMANLGELESRAQLLEFSLNQRPVDIAEALLAGAPRIIGLGVYIWNIAPSTELVAALKRIRPDVTIILGGPEVSYETAGQPIVGLADYVVTGEGDRKFAEICHQLLGGILPDGKIIAAEPPPLDEVKSPYHLYTADDLANRVLYVEASRGCPFTCEFCLSSLEIPVRQAPLPAFLDSLQRLIERGARQLKFVDRTFNLNVTSSRAILEFLLTRWQPGFFFHFEMIPDRLPDALRTIIAKFPAGALQFEVGVQTFNPEVAVLISRRQNYQRLEENFRFLRSDTGVHVHADLIAGLPGESMESFGAGFDRLIALGPQEIQVGILKRLRGTPIVRHDREWEMIYNPHAPYEVLQTKVLPFRSVQRLRRFARYWDLVGNSGNFLETTPLFWRADPSPFAGFLRFSDWLFERAGRTDSIALPRLMELVFAYLTDEIRIERAEAVACLCRDYQRDGRLGTPPFLSTLMGKGGRRQANPAASGRIPQRQRKHLRAVAEPSLSPVQDRKNP